MFLPYGTDAPIYHRPIGTIGLIVLNTLLLPGSDALLENGYSLDLGVGLHPVQWVTNNFLHGGIMHLVGNMLFLWAYGLVVEGKLGTFRFLLAYLAIGTAYGALVQTLFLGAETIDGEPMHVLGASAAIFGLLGMAMVWAPQNCLSCLVIMRGFGGLHEIPIVWFAALQVGLEGLELFLRGATGAQFLSSAFLHVCGFGMGFAIGLLMLRLDWVDCEGWDLLTLTGKRFGKGSGPKSLPKTRKGSKSRRPKAVRRDSVDPADDSPPGDRAASAVERLRKRLDQGDIHGAIDIYLNMAPTWKSWGWALPEPDLMRLIKAAQAAGLEADAIPMMFDYAKRYPEKAARVRLRLALLLIEKQQRPAKALRVLGEIAPGELPDNLDGIRGRLVAKAEALIDEGVLELETDD